MNEPTEHEARHLRGQGTCPACGSHQIEGDSIDFYGASICQECWCIDCDKAWIDEYKLVDFAWRA